MWAMLQTGIAARIRAQTAELKLRLSQREQETAALEGARQLDADEIGQRADRRRAEREAAGEGSGSDDTP